MVRTKEMTPRMRFFIARVFPLPFLLVGVLALFFGLRGLYWANESTTWPTSDGIIQNSTVEYQSGKKGGSYHAKVSYRFPVDGQTHSGNQVAFGDYGSSNPSHAQTIVNRYPRGKAVKVYYRTGDPDTCVLEPGLQGQAWFLPGFGLIFFLAGSLMSIYLPKAMRKSEKPTEQPLEADATDLTDRDLSSNDRGPRYDG